jgi:hypothetical protein
MPISGFAPHLFGAPIGFLAEQQNLLQTATGLADIEQKLADAALKPARQGLLEAQTREIQDKLEQNRLLREALMKARAPTGTPLDEHLSNLADSLFQQGQVEAGMKAAETAAKLQTERVRQQSLLANQQLRQFEMQKKQLDVLASLLEPGAIKSQQDFDMANALYTVLTGKPSMFLGVQYSPELVELLRKSVLPVKEQIDQQLTKARDAARAKYFQDITAIRQRQAAAQEARARAYVDHLDRLSKQGVPVKTPNKEMVEYARQLLAKDFPATKENAPERDRAAATIASEAARLMAENRGLGMSEAVGRALAMAKERGDIAAGDKAFAFENRGVSPENPAPLPPPDQKDKLVKGRYYEAHGNIYLYDGKGLIAYKRRPTQVKTPAASGVGLLGSFRLPFMGGGDDSDIEELLGEDE